MDDRYETVDGQEPEVTEIASMERASEASVLSVAEATEDRVVVVKPKRGRGLAALFGRKPREDSDLSSVLEAPKDTAAQTCCHPELDSGSGTHEEMLNQVQHDKAHRNGQLKSVLECMLFVSNEPLTAKLLADTLEIDEASVEQGINDLEAALEARGGLQLMRVAGGGREHRNV